MHHLKVLEPGSSGSRKIRSLFAFDPIRRAVLLVAGDRAGDWQGWYNANIPLAERCYQNHLAELDSRGYE
ncbi:type II toxin-antitoxin system RelE/ParE family toxin [Streptomyces sp. 35M1]|uniref:addiction module toxin RelE n=1 Tax=Streptomyces sp. 35M1 TaxID=3142978 RepID=UPI0039908FB2